MKKKSTITEELKDLEEQLKNKQLKYFRKIVDGKRYIVVAENIHEAEKKFKFLIK